MQKALFTTLILLITLSSFSQENKGPAEPTTYPDKTIHRITFGSCADQNKKQPILYQAAGTKPDLFIYLGDNIYGDTEDMQVLKDKYAKLAEKIEFKTLNKHTQVLAIWDDHDYGVNDGGREYPKKAESKEIFLDFWKEPKVSQRREHEGIYHSILFGQGDRVVQVILLDTRTFRDRLTFRDKNDKAHKNDYIPNESTDSTFLGEQQWKWLEEQFKVKANIRIIASSNQFCHEYNGYESWTNVPHEQQRMIDLIKKTRANDVIFLSGDVHWGEISKLPVEDGYPIYDVTSSGITQEWGSTEPNKYRVGEVVRENNFGQIDIDWLLETIEMKLVNVKGEVVESHSVKFHEIMFPN